MTIAEGRAQPRVRVGSSFSCGSYTSRRLLAMASAAPDDSTDPVDKALKQARERIAPDIELPSISAGQLDPASPQRRYSLTAVPDFPLPDDERADLVIMRGDFEAVRAKASIERGKRYTFRRNADLIQRRRQRPLAVATAELDADGVPGPFTMQGFVSIGVGGDSDAAPAPGEWVRVNVWSATLRLQHWVNVALIFVLSCTGYYIMDPFFGPQAHEGARTGYLMGWVRLVHYVSAFLWLTLGVTRIGLSFFSRDQYLRWPALWPLRSKKDVRYLGQTLQHYLFLRHEGPFYLAHNPLQQLAYTGLYVACAFQMLTGFAIFGLYHQASWFWALVSTPVQWLGIPAFRLIHTMLMFCLWAFVIMHVYLAIRADSLERHGGVSSMFNGAVWVHRGARPVDALEIK